MSAAPDTETSLRAESFGSLVSTSAQAVVSLTQVPQVLRYASYGLEKTPVVRDVASFVTHGVGYTAQAMGLMEKPAPILSQKKGWGKVR